MRRVVKRVMLAAFRALVLPLVAWYRLASLVVGQAAAFQGMSQMLSLAPGLFGNYLRLGFYRYTLRACSASACISFGTIFSDPRAEIGEHVYIGAFCDIGWARIGDDTLLGSGVHVTSGRRQHRFDDLSRPIRLQGGEFTCVRIGADCWIGNGAIVMADVGDHSVVGAGAVVAGAVQECSVVVGSTARLVATRRHWEVEAP